MEPERLLEKPLLHSGRPRLPDSPQPLASLTAGGVQSKPAKNRARQGAPPLKEKKKGLLIVVCGIGEIPQPELPVEFYQRVCKAASQERSSLGEVTLSPFLIWSLNGTYIVTPLLGISYLPNWIWSCWRVPRVFQVLWNKPSDPARSNKIRSCSVIICTREPTHSILEQMSL